MTAHKLPDKQRGFADLRTLLEEQVCNSVVPSSEIGTLPEDKTKQIKRLTLHLDSFKTQAENCPEQIAYTHSGR